MRRLLVKLALAFCLAANVHHIGVLLIRVALCWLDRDKVREQQASIASLRP